MGWGECIVGKEEKPGLLEVVDTGGWCANNLGMGPEYPGLDESEEYASWRILHWISRLDQ
jgi:hypothetical protein